MRLGPFFIVLFVIHISIGLLDKVLSTTLNEFQTVSTGSTFMDLLIQPWMWSNNAFILIVLGSVFTVSAITAATAYLTRSDILVLAGLAGIFISMGAIPIVNLYSFVTRNVEQYACTPGDCMASAIIGGLTAGVIGLMYVMTVLEWWLWRPTTQ